MSNTLKHILIYHPEPALRIAQKAGKHETQLSKVVRGLIRSYEIENQKLSEIWGRSVGELLPAYLEVA